MLHPLMPFITEELWNAMGERPYELIVAKWPEPQAQVDPHAKAELEWLDRGWSAKSDRRGRSSTSRLSAKLDLFAVDRDPTSTLAAARPQLRASLSRTWPAWRSIQLLERSEAQALAQIVVDEATYALAARRRDRPRRREGAAVERPPPPPRKNATASPQRLANPNFTERAKPEAVEKARADHEAKAAEAERLRAALERLG